MNNTRMTIAVGISRLSACQHNSSGNKDSGSWSNPNAILLGGMPRRRLIKLDNRSPAMDAAANKAPISNGYPINIAPTEVTTIEETIPRIVFDAPNHGRPSKNNLPASRGSAMRAPSNFFTTTGVPLANSNKNKILIISSTFKTTILNSRAAGYRTCSHLDRCNRRANLHPGFHSARPVFYHRQLRRSLWSPQDSRLLPYLLLVAL